MRDSGNNDTSISAFHREASLLSVDRTALEFSESGGEWRPIPAWARFLIQFGYSWPMNGGEPRRIGLVSMPCDSAGAGLMALGAMRRRLEVEGANDLRAHFERIRTLAARQCGGTDIFDQRSRGSKRGPYYLDGEYDKDMSWACLRSKPGVRVTISATTSHFWRFSNEPPVEIIEGAGIRFGDIYSKILSVPETVLRENLNHSDSLICLAGRPTGDAGTKRVLAELRLRSDADTIATLAELLTVHDWQSGTVSRVTFFNSRTGRLDREGRPPRLVLCDGEQAFLLALNQFPNSDVVGIMNRCADREKLEMVGSRMVDLNQWYEGDAGLTSHLPSVPVGVMLLLLKAR